MTTHSPECESLTREKIKQLEPALEKLLERYRIIQERYQAGETNLVAILFEAANHVMAVDLQIEKHAGHLRDHKLDKLETRVLELEMNTEELVRQAVKNYFSVELDSKDS